MKDDNDILDIGLITGKTEEKKTPTTQPATPKSNDQPTPPAPTPEVAHKQLSTERKTTATKKTNRRTQEPSKRQRWARAIVAGFVTFAAIMGIMQAPLIIQQIQYSASSTSDADNNAVVATDSQESILSIPKISVNVPIIYEPSIQEPEVQKALEEGVVHYGPTALPGQPGNNVLVGHSSNDWWKPGNYKFVFLLLDRLVVGDTMSVNYRGQRYIYEVTQTKVVEASDVSVLQPTATPSITLITCTPPGTSWRRLVVVAKQISPEPSKAAPADATSDLAKLPADSNGNVFSRLWQWIVQH